MGSLGNAEKEERPRPAILDCGGMTPLSAARHVVPNQSADMSAHSKGGQGGNFLDCGGNRRAAPLWATGSTHTIYSAAACPNRSVSSAFTQGWQAMGKRLRAGIAARYLANRRGSARQRHRISVAWGRGIPEGFPRGDSRFFAFFQEGERERVEEILAEQFPAAAFGEGRSGGNGVHAFFDVISGANVTIIPRQFCHASSAKAFNTPQFLPQFRGGGGKNRSPPGGSPRDERLSGLRLWRGFP